MKLYKGRPTDETGREAREIRVYDFLDELGIEYDSNCWSEEEINILTELSNKVYIREIAKILNYISSSK